MLNPLPTTLNAAVDFVIASFTDKDRRRLATHRERWLGGIDTHYGPWTVEQCFGAASGNPELLSALGAQHAFGARGWIIQGVRRRLEGQSIDYELEPVGLRWKD